MSGEEKGKPKLPNGGSLGKGWNFGRDISVIGLLVFIAHDEWKEAERIRVHSNEILQKLEADAEARYVFFSEKMRLLEDMIGELVPAEKR